MIFLLSIFNLFWGILRGKNIRFVLFSETIVLSFFFFSSSDPFIGMPVYIYFLFLSIIFSFNNFFKILNKHYFLYFICILFFLLIQMLALWVGVNNPPALLINISTTDTLNIISQLHTPSLDINVIKHFLFYFVFLIFVLVNRDLILNFFCIKKIKKYFLFFYTSLFLIIFVQSFLINFINISQNLFSSFFKFFFTLSYSNNYTAFGIKAAQGWLVEPSSIGIILPLLIYLFQKKQFSLKNILFLFMTNVATFLTTSTTGIVMSITFSFLIIFKGLICKNYFLHFSYKFFFLLLLVLGLIFIFTSFDLNFIFNKIIDFFNPSSKNWGSGTFRGQSLVLALSVFLKTPFLGLGIGTVYCHGMFIQLLSQVGILGVICVFFFFASCLNLRITSKNIISIFLTLIFGCATYLIEQFTSPFILVILSAIYSKELYYKLCNLKLPLLAIIDLRSFKNYEDTNVLHFGL